MPDGQKYEFVVFYGKDEETQGYRAYSFKEREAAEIFAAKLADYFAALKKADSAFFGGSGESPDTIATRANSESYRSRNPGFKESRKNPAPREYKVWDVPAGEIGGYGIALGPQIGAIYRFSEGRLAMASPPKPSQNVAADSAKTGRDSLRAIPMGPPAPQDTTRPKPLMKN